MSMADNPGPDDPLFAQLADIEEPQVKDLSKLSDLQLHDSYEAIRQELLARNELVTQTTDRGRELMSERTAHVLALKSRGLM